MSVDPIPQRNWMINGQGQTLAVIHGPVTFPMGSVRASDPDSLSPEVRHTRRIPRSFVIGMHEVTLGQYARFLDDKPVGVMDNRQTEQLRSLTPDFPALGATWYEAARYCNWLSSREGIPETAWCYPKNMGPDSTLSADLLDRAGYRLPTEAEWEFACRAGTVSARPFGHSAAWLTKYAWLERQSASLVNPTGKLKPNDLGLFDILSNAYEWCGSAHRPYPSEPRAEPYLDTLEETSCRSDVLRVLRGGTVMFTPATLRSAFRSSGVTPLGRYFYIGFRVARTFPGAATITKPANPHVQAGSGSE